MSVPCHVCGGLLDCLVHLIVNFYMVRSASLGLDIYVTVSGRLGGLPLGAILLPFVTPRLFEMAVGWTCVHLVLAICVVDED